MTMGFLVMGLKVLNLKRESNLVQIIIYLIESLNNFHGSFSDVFTYFQLKLIYNFIFSKEQVLPKRIEKVCKGD